MATNPTDLIRKLVNPNIKGPNTQALIDALGLSDAKNEEFAQNVKKQLLIISAEGDFLDKQASAIGIERNPDIGVSDDVFREFAILQNNSKMVTPLLLAILEVFYGEDVVKANVTSLRPEGYGLEDGMNLLIGVDNNATPLEVIFKNEDFQGITQATAAEVATAISRAAFNSGLNLKAESATGDSDGLNYVKMISNTRGPSSSITILGGSAQPVLQFPNAVSSSNQVGTTWSVTNPGNNRARFTWIGGADPNLSQLGGNSVAVISGTNFNVDNRGSFEIENFQNGTVGNAYFEVLNPNFVTQSSVVSLSEGATGGGGVATVSSGVSNITRSSNVVTVTTSSNHGFVTGLLVTITGSSNESFNSTFRITGIGAANQFTFLQEGVNTSAVGGSVSQSYEIASPGTGAVRSSATSTITTSIDSNIYVGQSVTISGGSDSSFNGTFSVLTKPTADSFTYEQTFSNDVFFYEKEKFNITSAIRYAAIYETRPRVITVFLPATTRIVVRTLNTGMYLNQSATQNEFEANYIFDESQPAITGTSTTTTESISQGSPKPLLAVGDSSQFPDESGFLFFAFGASQQEGPVKYLYRPSDNLLALDPSYVFQNTHDTSTDVTLLVSSSAYVPSSSAQDRQAFLTGTIPGREEAIAQLENLVAAGFFLNIIILYPQNPGLHDIEGYVYGPDLES